MKIPTSAVSRGALLLGGLHLAAFMALALDVIRTAWPEQGQWQMEWFVFYPVDWPISKLMFWDGWPRQRIEWLPHQLGDPYWFFVPCFVFGVLGTLWYAAIGALLGLGIKKLKHHFFQPRN
jgi:hypothetical protein